MSRLVDPLSHNTPIVVKETGAPNFYFLRQWQNLIALVADIAAALAAAAAAQTTADAAAAAAAAAQADADAAQANVDLVEAAQFVTMATNATLTNERVLTAGDGIDITDGGAGGAVTISVEDDVAAIYAPKVTGETPGPVAIANPLGEFIMCRIS
jgi:hypothetical protein